MVMVSPCCRGYGNLKNADFFKTLIYSLKVGTVRFPALFQASLHFLFKEIRDQTKER